MMESLRLALVAALPCWFFLGAGEAAVIEEFDEVPVSLKDENGRLYVAVPADLAGEVLPRLWDQHSTVRDRAAEVFRISPEEKRKIRQVLKKAWFKMNPCRSYCRVSRTLGRVDIRVSAIGMGQISKRVGRISSEILDEISPFIGEERSEVMRWLGRDSIRFATYFGFAKPRSKPVKDLQITILPVSESKVHLKDIERHADGSMGKTDLERSVRYLPWPGLARWLGVEDDALEKAWDDPGARPRDIPAIPPSVPVGAIDKRGKRFIFIPAVMILRSSSKGLSSMLVRSREKVRTTNDVAFNPAWRRILRLDRTADRVLRDAILRAARRLDDAFYNHSSVAEKDADKVLVETDQEFKRVLQKVVEEEISRVSGALGAEKAAHLIDIVRTGLTLPDLPELGLPGAGILSYGYVLIVQGEVRGPLTVSVRRAGRNLRVNVGLARRLWYGKNFSGGDHVPPYVWRFCPPGFGDLAPKGITPGDEDCGPKLLRPGPVDTF